MLRGWAAREVGGGGNSTVGNGRACGREYVVGAYLKLEEECDFVDFNVRPPGGGLKGLGE